MSQVLRIRQDVPETPEACISEFLLLKKAEGRSPATLTGYGKVLRPLYARHPETWEHPREGVIAYLGKIENPNTYNIAFAYIKCFFDWTQREGYLSGRHPLEGLKKRKPSPRFVEVNTETIQAMLAAPNRSTYCGLRDYALMLLSLDVGVRPAEGLRLVPANFDFTASEVTVPARIAKTRVQRMLPVSTQAMKVIREFMSVRHPSWKPHVPVFCTEIGTPMSTEVWDRRIKEYSERIGVKVIPYFFRHFCATMLLRNGANAYVVQEILGHSSPVMTARYVHLVNADIREAHKMFSPATSVIGEPLRVDRKIR